MFCSKCGNELGAGDAFCRECGAKVNAQSNNIIHLTCQNCGNSMTFDDDKQIVACPYCGSKELLLESDDVKIERIKSNTILTKEKMANDFVMEKRRYDEEMRKKRDKENIIAVSVMLALGILMWIAIILFTR